MKDTGIKSIKDTSVKIEDSYFADEVNDEWMRLIVKITLLSWAGIMLILCISNITEMKKISDYLKYCGQSKDNIDT